jgi:hypothetical protein
MGLLPMTILTDAAASRLNGAATEIPQNHNLPFRSQRC